jgi:hypothetical protein
MNKKEKLLEALQETQGLIYHELKIEVIDTGKN